MAGDGTWTVVTVIPPCDINNAHGAAYADASINVNGRRVWGNVCRSCFFLHDGRLGTGAGQELLLEPTAELENGGWIQVVAEAIASREATPDQVEAWRKYQAARINL